MIHQKLMIAGLWRQHEILETLLDDLSHIKTSEPIGDRGCEKKINNVAENLRKLRDIQKDYCVYLHAPICLQ